MNFVLISRQIMKNRIYHINSRYELYRLRLTYYTISYCYGIYYWIALFFFDKRTALLHIFLCNDTSQILAHGFLNLPCASRSLFGRNLSLVARLYVFLWQIFRHSSRIVIECTITVIVRFSCPVRKNHHLSFPKYKLKLTCFKQKGKSVNQAWVLS